MRRRREIIIGSAYHVCARINRQEMILENNQFKIMFLEVVARAKKKYRFKFRNFCIMGNHIHLDIQPPEETSISKVMQWILSVFAIRYNKVLGYKGHVWYDRFKSKVIQTIQQFINTFKYISNNPVRAGLVKHPLNFAFSGISFYRSSSLHFKDLLDPPDSELNNLMDNFITLFEPDQATNFDEQCSFINKKPGLKKHK